MLARCWLGQAALLMVAVAAPAAAQEGLSWETNLEAAQRLATETNRLVLIHFSAPWCPPCQRLEQQVFSQPGFGSELAANFVAVKLNYDHFPATARQYGVRAIPADVIITPQGELVQKLQSPPTATEYVGTMDQIANQVAGSARPQPAQEFADRGAHDAPTRNVQAGFGQTANAGRPDDRYADYYNRRANPQQPVAPEPGHDQAQSTAQGFCQVPDYEPSGAISQGNPQGLITQPRRGVRSRDPVQSAGLGTQARSPAPAPAQAQDTSATTGVVGSGYQQHEYALGNQHGPRNGPSDRQPVIARHLAPPQIPPGNPPLGLEGFCPVTLGEKKAWAVGDVRFGAIHRGRTYLFAGPEEQQQFLANPDKYSPVISGNDPVLALDQNRVVPGRREYGVFGYDGRVYLFASESSLVEFERNPNRYAAEALQAMRQR